MKRATLSSRLAMMRMSILAALAVSLSVNAAVPNYTTTAPFDSVEAKRRQVETAAALGMPVADTIMLPGNVPLELRVCPAGWFRMGSPTTEDGHEYDETMKRAIIPQPFYASTFVLTQAQYQAIMGALPTGTTTYRADYPARISYEQIRDQLLPAVQSYAPPTWQFDIITQGDMEYATRAGTQTEWYTGDSEAVFATAAWYDANSGGVDHAVGLKIPNAWGFYDMLGNVWQWVNDGSGTTTHLVKGGDCRSPAGGNGCRSANIMIQDVPSAYRVLMKCTLNLMTGTRNSLAVPHQGRQLHALVDQSHISGSITITGLSGDTRASILLVGLSGGVIRSDIACAAASSYRLATGVLTPGTYLLQVTQGRSRFEQKLNVR
jgi:formylglycine-generating enzyme required for sulfatase activity